MSGVNWNELLERLSEPFPAKTVSFRAGATNRDKTKAMALAYVDMREYFKRLDDVCPGEWHSDFLPWGENQIICKLTIYGVTRSSTGNGDSSDVETGTSAEAQAFKRACVAFGLGRYLYELPTGWVAYDKDKKRLVETPKLPSKFLPKIRGASASPTMPLKAASHSLAPLLTPERAKSMYDELVKMGLDSNAQKRLASEVTGRLINKFTDLTEAEATAVYSQAKENALRGT